MRNETKLYPLLFSLALPIVGCGKQDKSSDNPQKPESEMSEAEALLNPAPEYILVKASKDGSTQMISSEQNVVLGSESEVASADAKLFDSSEAISVLEGDDNKDQKSSESFYYGSHGKGCYSVYGSSYYRAGTSYLHGHAGYQNQYNQYSYQTCQPVYRHRGYRTTYNFIGRAYHQDGYYINRYRKAYVHNYGKRQSYTYGNYNQNTGYSVYGNGQNTYQGRYATTGYSSNGVEQYNGGSQYYTGRNYGQNYTDSSYQSASYGAEYSRNHAQYQ